MNWRRLERWAIIATVALYVAAAVSVIILIGESLLPEGSPVQRALQDAAHWLTRLGGIGGGTVVIIILLVMAGGGIYVLILKAIDKYHENRERRARAIAEALDQGREEGREKGRAEGRAELLDQLRERGYSVDEFLSPEDTNSEPERTD